MIKFIVVSAIFIVFVIAAYRIGGLNKELDFLNYISYLNRNLDFKFNDIENPDIKSAVIKAEADIIIEMLKYFGKGGVDHV